MRVAADTEPTVDDEPMTPEEKAAAAEVTARAVSGINDVIERVSAVTRGKVKRALRPLGPAAAAPMASVDATHLGIHSLIRHGSTAIGSAAGAAMRRWADQQAPSITDSPAGLVSVAGLGAAFGDNLPEPLGPHMTMYAPEDIGTADAVAVFVHGLGGHEQQWSIDYAIACAYHDVVPVFVRYTTGKAIDANAAELGELLAQLESTWPGGPLRRIILVGHSMGGLVAARALQLAGNGSTWSPLVSDLVTLGSPLAGAPLERVSDAALNAVINYSPTAAPVAEIGHQRSAGIKDLGHGIHAPVPAHVAHLAVVAAVGPTTSSVTSRLIGDGIVPTASARGRHHDAETVRVVELPHSHHLSLLDHPAVIGLLRDVVAAGVTD